MHASTPITGAIDGRGDVDCQALMRELGDYVQALDLQSRGDGSRLGTECPEGGVRIEGSADGL